MVFQKIKNAGRATISRLKPNFESKFWERIGLHRDKVTKLAVADLIEKSRLDISFFVMCSLSGALATVGIILEEIPVLIAAMVLAPLLNPILAFAAGVSLLNKKLIFYATKSIIGSIFWVVLSTAALTKFFVWQNIIIPFDQIADKFLDPHHLFFLAALLSGFSGVYSWLRAKEVSNLIGVAIAVSLIPFVSFLGILVGLEKWDMMRPFSIVFGANFGAIIGGAFLAFVMLGFSRKREAMQKEISQEIAAE